MDYLAADYSWESKGRIGPLTFTYIFCIPGVQMTNLRILASFGHQYRGQRSKFPRCQRVTAISQPSDTFLILPKYRSLVWRAPALTKKNRECITTMTDVYPIYLGSEGVVFITWKQTPRYNILCWVFFQGCSSVPETDPWTQILDLVPI